MMSNQPIPVNKTYLNANGSPEGQRRKVEGALNGLVDLDSLKENKLKEVQARLYEKGLTTDALLNKYKSVMEEKNIKYKGADVLKVCERLERLHGLSDNSDDQMQVRALIQSKNAQEITTTLIEITGKTQAYLNKLQGLQNR